MRYTPSAELVAVAWLKKLQLPLTSDVSTTLPAVTRWTQPCYVQASSAGARGVRHGMVDANDPGRESLIRVDVWAAAKKFGESNSIAEFIVDATYEGIAQNADMPIRTGFWPVHLAEVSVWQPPVTIRDVPSFAALDAAELGPRVSNNAAPSQSKLARTTLLLALVYQINRS